MGRSQCSGQVSSFRTGGPVKIGVSGGGDQIGESAASLQQVVGSSRLHDAAVVEEEYLVSVHHGAQPMGDDDPRTGQLFQLLFDAPLGVDVQVTRRLVEQQDGRASRYRPGQCETLALAAGLRRGCAHEDSVVAQR